jgi:hypothetical protein
VRCHCDVLQWLSTPALQRLPHVMQLHGRRAVNCCMGHRAANGELPLSSLHRQMTWGATAATARLIDFVQRPSPCAGASLSIGPRPRRWHGACSPRFHPLLAGRFVLCLRSRAWAARSSGRRWVTRCFCTNECIQASRGRAADAAARASSQGAICARRLVPFAWLAAGPVPTRCAVLQACPHV